jgi:hypothetical protein
MKLITIDPRALKPNPDPMRRTPATPQADALLLATIKAVGIVQPPIVSPQQDGGNGYTIQYGIAASRRRSPPNSPRSTCSWPIPKRTRTPCALSLRTSRARP